MSKEQIDKLTNNIFGAVFAFILVGLTLTYFMSQQEFIKSTNDTPSPIVGVTGETVEYCRDIEYFKDSDVTVSKILIKSTEENVTIIPLSPTRIQRLSGYKHRICKTLFLGSHIPMGTWILETYIERKQFPFWTHTERLRDITIMVGKKD